ncbi:AAA family ATPase [Candidatus Nomurabacteria bacterium]|nr:AAA family ATPase [Candidatus Nomurabacteria bacterium]
MYTEIIKIIEGGLKKEPAKVVLYAKKLAEKLSADGNEQLAKGIMNLLSNKAINSLTMEQLINTAPVDQETRMSIVDVFNPALSEIDVVLSETIENKVSDFIKIIQYRDKIKQMGLFAQNTLLLYGAPGVGKTTIAKYISLKTGLPLVTVRLDTVISSLLGNTSKNIRKIFEYADSKPCILFLDEFDAIAKARDDQHEMGELKRVINSLIQNIDSFTQNNVMIAATNHPELLDKAIWRRFNTVIEVEQPDAEGISKIMSMYLDQFANDYHTDKKKYEKVLQLFAKKTPSDIKSIINNAITLAVVNGRIKVTAEDLMIENYQFETRGKFTLENLIKYLNDNGVSKLQIADLLNISIRQIRNNLKD